MVPAVPKTQGLAVASFVVAMVSLFLFFVVIPGVVAAVLGFVALRKMKREENRKGRGLAIAGVIIGILATLGGIAFDAGIALFASTTSTYEDLKAGDCLEDPGDSVVLVQGQSCSDDHDRQVYFVADIPEPSSAPYPGSTIVRNLAEGQCLAQFTRFSNLPDRSDLRVYYLVPDRDSWEDDDNRRVICMAGNRDGSPLTRSLPGLE